MQQQTQTKTDQLKALIQKGEPKAQVRNVWYQRYQDIVIINIDYIRGARSFIPMAAILPAHVFRVLPPSHCALIVIKQIRAYLAQLNSIIHARIYRL